MGSYAKIFNQAWELTKTHKFLWLFGLFLILGNVLNFLFSFQNQNQSSEQAKATAQRYSDSLMNKPALAAVVFIGLIVLFLLLLVLYFRAKAGSIIAIKNLLDHKPTSFKPAFKASRLFYRRLFGVSFILTIILASILMIVAVPIIYLVNLQLLWQAGILVLIGLVIVVPIAVVITLMSLLSPLFIVIFDQKIGEALSRSFALVSRHWAKLLVFSFLLLILTICAFFLTILAAGIGAAVFVLLAYLAYHNGGLMIGNILTVISLVAGFLVFLILQSSVVIFAQTSWVIAFTDLVKPEKLEEEEPLPVPEAVV